VACNRAQALSRLQFKHLAHKAAGNKKSLGYIAHGDGVNGTVATIVTVSWGASECVYYPTALASTDEETALAHEETVDWRAFEPENAQAIALAVIPHAHGAVGGGGVEDMQTL
jgi:hypothetical protein